VLNLAERLERLFMKSSMPPKNKCSQARSTKRPGPTSRHRKPVADSSPESPRIGKRILLVDDDATVRSSLNEVLVGEGSSSLEEV
jgi:PleD family two-component response regulator